MYRWFYANDEIFCEPSRSPPTSRCQISATSSDVVIAEINWSFKVQFNWRQQPCGNEFLAICGSCASLGNWDVQAGVPLKRTESTAFWTATVVLPRDCDIRYRYFVCALDFKGRKFVRFWETHFGARLIGQQQFQNVNSKAYEIFGLLNGESKIERGWLKPFVTVIQLKFYQAPFVLKSCGEKALLQVKVTPVKLKTAIKCGQPTGLWFKEDAAEDEYFSAHNAEMLDATFAFCEVASLQDANGEFRMQDQHGTPCGPDHLVIFNITVNVMEQCAFLVDLYQVPARCAPDVPPNYFGYQYILPAYLEKSGGALELPIICSTRHRPIGAFKCDYLIVRPMNPFYEFSLEKTFQSYWNAKNQGQFCGHRGCGRSFWLRDDILRENSLKSFDLAIQHGADMIEFDVQLTKDLIPIIYHDVQLCVSKGVDLDPAENDIMRLPLTRREMNLLKFLAVKVDKDFYEVPVSKFTLEQLGRVQVHDPNPAQEAKTTCSPPKSNQAFVTLQQVLSEINANIGFVVDIKWPKKSADVVPVTDFDKNLYVDTILSVVLENAGCRHIIFYSIDADICTMIRLKQNLYPVVYKARTAYEKLRMDPHKTISSRIYFAHAMEFWGIGINCANIWYLPGNIHDLHERGLFVLSWGMSTRYADKRKYLKKLGVDVIICDRLNHALKPLDLKKNVFYVVPLEIISKEIKNVINYNDE